MKLLIAASSIIVLISISNVYAQPRTARWTEKQSWDWYTRQPWFCGFNYIPAYAINYTAMWDKTSFDPQAIDRELALAEKLGFNCLRAVLQYAVFAEDSTYFLTTIDSFLSIAAWHKIKFMPALFDDCVFGLENDPVTGKQPDPLPGWYAWAWSPSPGHSMVLDSSKHPLLEKYVRSVIGRFAKDERIFIWDLYNEPTNGGIGTPTLPLLSKVIRWAREAGPEQPLTIGVFDKNERLNEIAIQGSDVVSFHNYGNKQNLEKDIAWLEQYKRPLINTEWMNRPAGSTIASNLDVFYQKKIGCMLWGLVNGKTQTDLPWGHRPGDPMPKQWQHDLFRSDGSPYDSTEIEMIKVKSQKLKGKR